MSAEPPLGEAMSNLNEISSILNSYRAALNGANPPRYPERILDTLIRHTSIVRSSVEQAQADVNANVNEAARIVEIETRLTETVRDLSEEKLVRENADRTVDNLNAENKKLVEKNTQLATDFGKSADRNASKQSIINRLLLKQEGHDQEKQSLDRRVSFLENELETCQATSDARRMDFERQKAAYDTLHQRWEVKLQARVQTVKEELQNDMRARMQASNASRAHGAELSLEVIGGIRWANLQASSASDDIGPEESVISLRASLSAEKNRTRALEASNATSASEVERLKLSEAAQAREIKEWEASSTDAARRIEQLQASNASKNSKISEIKEEHRIEINMMWKRVHELGARDHRSQPAALDRPRSAHGLETTLNRRAGASTTTPTPPADTEVISISDDDGNDSDSKSVQPSQDRESRYKRPLNAETEESEPKRSRLSHLGEAASTDGTSTSVQSIGTAVQASNSALQLWNMFVCAWDIDTIEKQILLRQFDSVLSRGRTVDVAIEQIETHIVGGFLNKPVHPRFCLLADLRRVPNGKGGSTLARSCPHCILDSRNRLCVWASYAPGVKSTFGGRTIDGDIPKGDPRQYNRNVTPWTVPIGGTNVR